MMENDNTVLLAARINTLEVELAKATATIAAQGKAPWYSKVNWFNLLALLTAIVTLLEQLHVANPVLAGLAIVGPVGNLILRQLTTQPIIWPAKGNHERGEDIDCR